MNQIEPWRNPKLLGTLLIALGLLFLVGQALESELVRLNWGDIPWPLYQIVPGIVLTALGLVLVKHPALTIIGVMCTITGFILWFQESTGAFQTWAYAWALVVPTSIGLGMLLHGVLTHQPSLVRKSSTLIVIGLALFAIGVAFFEFTLNLSGINDSGIGRFLGPVVLIGLGLYLFVRRNNPTVNEEPKVK